MKKQRTRKLPSKVLPPQRRPMSSQPLPDWVRLPEDEVFSRIPDMDRHLLTAALYGGAVYLAYGFDNLRPDDDDRVRDRLLRRVSANSTKLQELFSELLILYSAGLIRLVKLDDRIVMEECDPHDAPQLGESVGPLLH